MAWIRGCLWGGQVCHHLITRNVGCYATYHCWRLDCTLLASQNPSKPSSSFHVPVPRLPRSPASPTPMKTGVDDDDQEETGAMLHCHTTNFEALRAFASSARCPRCNDVLIAPLVSEFVESGEIRHHWACETCGEPSSSTIVLAGRE